MSCLIDVPQGDTMIFLFTLVPRLYDCSNRNMRKDGTSLLCPCVRKPRSFIAPVGRP